MRSYNHGVADTEVDLGGIARAVATRARAMTPEFDPGGFLEGLSGQLQGVIPHDRVTVLYLDEGGRTVSVFAEDAPGDAPRRDGGDNTPQVDLSVRHVVIIRPHFKRCRAR